MNASRDDDDAMNTTTQHEPSDFGPDGSIVSPDYGRDYECGLCGKTHRQTQQSRGKTSQYAMHWAFRADRKAPR